jgi:hypothetical protein
MILFTKKTAPSEEEQKKILQEKLNESFLIAASNNDVEKTQQLYEQGADVNYQDTNGNTSLHKSVENHHFEMVKFLVETTKADVSILNHKGAMAEDTNYTYVKRYLQKAFDIQHEQKKPTGWIKTADDEIAHIMFREPIGYRVTEVFNFSARTYAHITQNLDTKAENKTLAVFDEFGNKAFLLNALQELKNRGGTAEESAIEGKHHLAKDTFGAKR